MKDVPRTLENYGIAEGATRITMITFTQFEDYDFIPPATWYVKSALGDYFYIHTAKRAVAQEWVDEHFGKGRYTVNASKIQKGKELGEDSKPAYGTATRKGQRK